MKTSLQIEGIQCDIFTSSTARRFTYMIYPEDELLSENWLTQQAKTYDTTIVLIYLKSPQWGDYLTPWPEASVFKSSPPFQGKAGEFLKLLKSAIIPRIESTDNTDGQTERNLIGVSLSGLFTFWQWLNDDIFNSIGSISGSFWYPGFMSWFEGHDIPPKSGKAIFLLGTKEPTSGPRLFHSVGEDTQNIVARLKENGIKCEFRWVEGNHVGDPLSRAADVFKYLYA